MVQHFIKQFKTDITSIPWVERYGGLARPISQVSTNKDGQTFIKKYPVSCEINSEQCFKKGRYLDLVPDEKYKSLVYWEQTGIVGMTPVQKMPEAYDLYEFRAPMQLVVWLNLLKLGFTGCDSEHIFAGHIFKVLAKASRKNMTSPYKIEQVTFTPKGILDNAAKVFAGYTYEDKQVLMMYPFAAFALRYELVWRAFINCLPEAEINSPISCLDLTI